MISSKGPLRNLYSKKETFEHSTEDEIIKLIETSDNILWIRTGYSKYFVNLFDKPYKKRKINLELNKDLDYLSKNIDKLKNPVILVTGDGPRDVPGTYNTKIINNILNNDNILVWYTQNYDKTIIHPKFKNYPIGFCLHAFLVENSITKKIEFTYNCRIKTINNPKIKHQIFTDCKAHLDPHGRCELVNKLKNNKNVIFSEGRKSYEEITQQYNRYLFVLSPKGHGMDCYRTWELFLAGAIVITKTCPLDDIYVSNNLPVVIIKDWDELNHNLEDKLKKWHDEHYHKTSLENIYPKLFVNYWLKQ